MCKISRSLRSPAEFFRLPDCQTIQKYCDQLCSVTLRSCGHSTCAHAFLIYSSTHANTCTHTRARTHTDEPYFTIKRPLFKLILKQHFESKRALQVKCATIIPHKKTTTKNNAVRPHISLPLHKSSTVIKQLQHWIRYCINKDNLEKP